MTLGKISFADLKNGNFDFEQDKNSCVIMGLSIVAPDMKELQDDAKDLDEVREQQPGMISLLQVDEDDRWHLVFYDCGMLNFLISPQDLWERRWDKVQCHLFSF